MTSQGKGTRMRNNMRLLSATIPGADSESFAATITPGAQGCTVAIIRQIGEGLEITDILETAGVEYRVHIETEESPNPADFRALFDLPCNIQTAIVYVEDLFREAMAPDFPIYTYGDDDGPLLEITPIDPDEADCMLYMRCPETPAAQLDAKGWATFEAALRDELGTENQTLRDAGLKPIEGGKGFLNLMVQGVTSITNIMLCIAKHYP